MLTTPAPAIPTRHTHTSCSGAPTSRELGNGSGRGACDCSPLTTVVLVATRNRAVTVSATSVSLPQWCLCHSGAWKLSPPARGGTACKPDNLGHSKGAWHHGDSGSDTHDLSDTSNNKAPATPGAQTATRRVPAALLAEAMEHEKCWFSNVARSRSGKRNQKSCAISPPTGKQKKGLYQLELLKDQSST